MSKNDKKVLIIISGVFLLIMSLVLFITFQKQDNMMSNTGRYNGNDIQLGDNCTSASYAESCPPNQDVNCSKITQASICMENGLDAPCYYVTCNSDPGGSSDPTVTTAPTQEPSDPQVGCCIYRNGTYYYTPAYSSVCAKQGRVVSSESECLSLNPTPTPAPCSAGWYRGQNGCEKCPAGYSCDGVSRTKCPGNTYSGEGASTCNTCPGGYTPKDGATKDSDCYINVPAGYFIETSGGKPVQCKGNTISSSSNIVYYGGTSMCSECGEDKTANSTHTACGNNEIPCCYKENDKYIYGKVSISESSTKCVSGVSTIAACEKLNNPTAEDDCNHQNEFWVNNKCIECPSGYRADANSNGTCYINVPAGSYLATGGGTDIRSCPANTYSTGGYYRLSGSSDNVVGVNSCISCGSGKTSPIGSGSKNDCVEATGKCNVSISTDTNVVSPEGNEARYKDERYPDHWTVTVGVRGDGCNGKKLVMSSSNAVKAGNDGERTVSDGQTFNFIYSTTFTCSNASVTATIKDSNGSILDSGSISVSTSSGWHKESSDICVPASTYEANAKSYGEADNKGVDIYYIALNNTKCTTSEREVEIWVRGCGGGSGGSSNPQVEEDACYKNSLGEYVVGKYKGKTGYDFVSNDTTKCNKIVITKVNDKGNQIQGATFVITKPNGSTETKSLGTYTMEQLTAGNYTIKESKEPDGYKLDTTIVEFTVKDGKITVAKSNNIYSRSTSDTPNAFVNIKNIPKDAEEDACYKNSSGEYVVGKYKGKTGYDFVSNDIAKCNKIVITKVNENGKQITGASFVITKPDGTKENPVMGSYTMENLEVGTYRIKESIVPSGYKLDTTEITFVVAKDGKITISNSGNIYSKSANSLLNAYVSVKNVPEVTSEKYCYIKRGVNGNENAYCYGIASKCSGFTEVVNKSSCDEEAYCYLINGEYKIGKFEGQGVRYGKDCPNPACYYNDNDGYRWTDKPKLNDVKVSSISSKDDCKDEVIVNKYCWHDSTNNLYIWSEDAPSSSYEKIDTINNPESCTYSETPACYQDLQTNIYHWGLYEKVVGYEKIDDVSEDNCGTEPACYMEKKTKKHIWGDYANNSSYELMKNVPKDDCNDVIPVPKTSLDIAQIIYIFAFIFTIIGAVFVLKRKPSAK